MSTNVGMSRLAPAAMDRGTMRAHNSSKPLSKAEVLARRVAMSASRKQPLSVRNRQRLEGGIVVSKKRSPLSDNVDDGKWDQHEQGTLPVNFCPDDSFGSESSSHSSGSQRFHDVTFDDSIDWDSGITSSTRSNRANIPLTDDSSKLDLDRLRSRTTKHKPEDRAVWLGDNISLKDAWRACNARVDSWNGLQSEPRRTIEESSHRKESKPREIVRPLGREGNVSTLNVSRRNKRESLSNSLESVLPKTQQRHSSRNGNGVSVNGGSTCSRQTSISLDTALKRREKEGSAKLTKGWGDSWGSIIATDQRYR